MTNTITNKNAIRIINRIIKLSSSSSNNIIDDNILSILNLTTWSVFDDVIKNYRSLSKIVHPDRNPPEYKELASKAFAALCRAKNILSDPQIFAFLIDKKRLSYKRQHSSTVSSSSPLVSLNEQQTKANILFSSGGFFSGTSLI